MIELKLPPKYNYRSSLNFVHPWAEPTPELWVSDRRLFIFPVENNLISIHFNEDSALIETTLDAQTAINYVTLKLNIDLYGLKTMYEGLKIAKKIGLLRKYPFIEGFMPPRLGDPPKWLYSGLIKTIILQMLSYKVARRMISRFVRSLGKPKTYEDQTTYTFPEAKTIYELPVSEIKRRAMVSMTKAQAIKEIARLELEGELEKMETMAWESPRQAVEELIKIKGIGYWTAYVSLMAGLGIWHAQPIDRLVTNLERIGIYCDKSVFVQNPPIAGYISVAVLFGEEALRGRYFDLAGVKKRE